MQLLPFRVSSAGQEAIDFAETCGLYLDDFQCWCVDWVLSELADGSWAALLVVILMPRQNGKNVILEVLELAALYLFDMQWIVHTAHLAATAAAHMKRMVGLISNNPQLDAISHYYFSNGKERIERTDTGAHLDFITRGRKTLRGGSPELVVLDEALFLTDDQLQAILPGLSAQSMNEGGGPQIVYTSSAPLPESVVLHRLRDAAIKLMSGRMFFAEWGCEEGVDINDRDAWAASNPGLGIRISEEWIAQTELPFLSRDAFMVERLGVVFGSDTGSHVLPAAKWAECLDRGSQTAEQVCLAVDVNPERSWTSLAIAGRRADGLAHVEVIAREPGTAWAAAVCKGAQDALGGAVRIASHGPAAGLLQELQLADVEVEEISESDYVQGCSMFQDAVLNARCRHIGQAPLDAAIVGAEIAPVGDSWKWSRKSSAVDISPLVAVTLAHWALDDGAEPTIRF